MTPMSKSIVFTLDKAGRPVTDSGKPVTCDGCGTRLEAQPSAEQQAPVPDDVARTVYGAEPGVLRYVVCERGVDCMTLAQIADELWDRCRCRVIECNGNSCSDGVRA
jgi:hypothetical protein